MIELAIATTCALIGGILGALAFRAAKWRHRRFIRLERARGKKIDPSLDRGSAALGAIP